MQRYLDHLYEMPLPNYRGGELKIKPTTQKRDHQGAYGNFQRDLKIVMYCKNHKGELYDLRQDPLERNNLWSNNEYTEVKLQMMERICRKIASMRDPLPPKVAPF